jgi:MFS transporter, Spinster family, sphingosine-1-phosphate transporter
VTGAARSVVQLTIFRGAVGVGEASYMSNAPNLIADLVPAAKRGSALAYFYIASPVGAALGVMIAGQLASMWGWRAACWIVGLPGLLIAFLVWKMREPIRGGTDNAGVVLPQPLGTVARELFSNRAFIFLCLAYTGQIFLQNAVEFWLPTIIQRDKAIPMLEATRLYGWVLLPSGIIGPLAGSFFADRLFKGTRRAYFGVCGISSLLMLIPLWSISATSARVPLFTAVFFQFIVAYMSTPLVLALVVTVVSPAIRSTATAVMLTTVHLLGDAISQPLVGRVSTSLENGTLSGGLITALGGFFQSGPNAHLTLAMMIVIAPAAVVSGLIYLVAMPRKTGPGVQGSGSGAAA